MEQKSNRTNLTIISVAILFILTFLVLALIIISKVVADEKTTDVPDSPQVSTPIPATRTPVIINTQTPQNKMFDKTVNYDRDGSVIKIQFTSFIPQDFTTTESTETTLPEGEFSRHIFLSDKNTTIDLEYNPYDAGGVLTANDGPLVPIMNKLNKNILRAGNPITETGKYLYTEFYSGECIQQVPFIITPIPNELYCGSPWINVTDKLQNIDEIVFLTCETKTTEGLNACDNFVVNLDITVTKVE